MAAIICVLLAAVVIAVFGQTLQHGFVNYDDNEYVYENPEVTGGLTVKGIAWAFTHVHSNNWHPITWISHMLDVTMFGLWPGGHHLTNVILHAATAILLFLALREMTGALPVCHRSKSDGVWCSAFVAAVFAIHPLHVESVAWVAERKDVLSGLFFMLTLLAYSRYARRARFSVPGSRLPVWSYLAVLLFFALGLMSKPMLVTLPFVLLLLDYWPLRRLGDPFQLSGFRFQVFLEKLPLFLLSAASCVVTVAAQREATVETVRLPLLWRVGNALVACATYLRQTVWPAGLAVLYPHPGSLPPISAMILSFAVLTAVGVTVFAVRRKHRYAVTGWLWFLGTLVPVMGLIQVGAQAYADRYTYLPQIGLLILLTWGVADITSGWRHRRPICGFIAALVVAALMTCAWIQTSYWRDSLTLWLRALDSTSNNAVAHSNLGVLLKSRGRSTEAIEQYRRALEINPDLAETQCNLANSLASLGQGGDAIQHYLRALQSDPRMVKAHYNLANLLVLQGRTDEAVDHYQRILEINADLVEVQFKMGAALEAMGSFADAREHYASAVELAPGNVSALNNLAWLLATCPEPAIRDGSKALELAAQADKLTGEEDPGILDTLAAAQAEAGRFAEAVETARRSLDFALQKNDSSLAGDIRMRLELYQAGSPYRGKGQTP